MGKLRAKSFRLGGVNGILISSVDYFGCFGRIKIGIYVVSMDGARHKIFWNGTRSKFRTERIDDKNNLEDTDKKDGAATKYYLDYIDIAFFVERAKAEAVRFNMCNEKEANDPDCMKVTKDGLAMVERVYVKYADYNVEKYLFWNLRYIYSAVEVRCAARKYGKDKLNCIDESEDAHADCIDHNDNEEKEVNEKEVKDKDSNINKENINSRILNLVIATLHTTPIAADILVNLATLPKLTLVLAGDQHNVCCHWKW